MALRGPSLYTFLCIFLYCPLTCWRPKMTEPETTSGVTRSQEIFQGQKDHIFPCVGHLYKDPVVMVRGEGTKVWDADGREYLDFFSGILTTSVGHCHPRIVDAITEQAKKLGHTSTLYVTEPQVEGAKKLAAITPGLGWYHPCTWRTAAVSP